MISFGLGSVVTPQTVIMRSDPARGIRLGAPLDVPDGSTTTARRRMHGPTFV